VHLDSKFKIFRYIKVKMHFIESFYENNHTILNIVSHYTTSTLLYRNYVERIIRNNV